MVVKKKKVKKGDTLKIFYYQGREKKKGKGHFSLKQLLSTLGGGGWPRPLTLFTRKKRGKRGGGGFSARCAPSSIFMLDLWGGRGKKKKKRGTGRSTLVHEDAEEKKRRRGDLLFPWGGGKELSFASRKLREGWEKKKGG